VADGSGGGCGRATRRAQAAELIDALNDAGSIG
jgi:hypothetical protein